MTDLVSQLVGALENFTDGCSMSIDAQAVARAALTAAKAGHSCVFHAAPLTQGETRGPQFALCAICGQPPRVLATQPAAPQGVIAWAHPDGRVVPASTKEHSSRDGGAMASSLAGYTIPCVAAQPAAQAGEREAKCKACNGHGLVGGHMQDGSGYGEGCPDCNPEPAPLVKWARDQQATPEPVGDVRCEGCGYMTHHREHMGCVRAAKQHTRPAQPVPMTKEQVRQAINGAVLWDCSPEEAYTAGIRHAEKVYGITAQVKGGE